MKVTYSTTFVGECPVDGTKDVYELTITTEGSGLFVENILSAIEMATQSPATQEKITELLREILNASIVAVSSIVTVGVHSGIRTTVTV